jgi:hypothetical protein
MGASSSGACAVLCSGLGFMVWALRFGFWNSHALGAQLGNLFVQLH